MNATNDTFDLPEDASSVAPSEIPPNATVECAFEFTGSGGEYFRIWILNLILSIITLGIYSAWAKVRREQYFHRNTLLDGSGFDYHGKAIAILKGRLIAYGLLVVLGLLKNFLPSFYIYALIAVAPIAPWLLVRSFSFRARNISYRGLHFNFHSTYRECLMTFLPYIILFVGTAFLANYATNEFISTGGMDFTTAQLWMMLSPTIAFALAFPAMYCALKRFQLNNLSFGDSLFKTKIWPRAFYAIFLRAALILIVFMLILTFCFVPFFISVMGGAKPEGGAIFLIFTLTMMLWYLVFLSIFLAYYQSRTANFVWNNTALDRHCFVSTQTFKGLFALTAVNWLFTLLTLGLYWPWAKVRLAAYRARNTLLVTEGGLDDFVGKVSEETRATGEEILDAFDFDISL
ncbi:MAG: DUF898 domain-containing protein [Candidatus Accumulibacter sp.]|jgi:uncharacterized membrane protein YjgN (DUF898 family)|nr:DUF898 domain-containing protein [Accumulibacter sp.]